MITTIQIDKGLKARLEELKIHPRETFNELISRMVDSGGIESATRESLIATIEVMSYPYLMKDLGEALKEEGGTPLEDLEEEFGMNV